MMTSTCAANTAQADDNERYFLNPDSVSRHLYCSICQDVFHEPQRAPCGHSFCKQCILPWLKHKKSCPEDRRPVNEKQLHYDFILANIIGDQMVACPYRKAGCSHIGQLQLLASHKKSCTFNPVNLPEFLRRTKDFTVASPPIKAARLDLPDDSDDEENKLPTPAKPSLKMRLFCSGDTKRDLLVSMFENKSREDTSCLNRVDNKPRSYSSN